MADMHLQPVINFVVIGDDINVPEAPYWRVVERLSTVTDWQVAFETIVALAPEFVLVDGDRFATDALALARQARMQALPIGVMLVTNRNDPAFLQQAALAGAEAVLPRHITVEQLHHLLSEIAEMPRWQQLGLAAILQSSPQPAMFSEMAPMPPEPSLQEITVLTTESVEAETTPVPETPIPETPIAETTPTTIHEQEEEQKEALATAYAASTVTETSTATIPPLIPAGTNGEAERPMRDEATSIAVTEPAPALPTPPTETAPEPPEPLHTAEHQGRVIAFSSGRGGVGKTTLLVNLAIALAQETNEPVAVLDLFIGDTLVLVNATARMTISEIPEAVREIDLELLRSCAFQHETGVHFFTWFFAPERNLPDYIDLNRLEAVLKVLREGYAYILMDTPVTLYVPDLELLRLADEVIVIAVPWDLPSVRATRALTMGMRQWGVTPKLLLNRVENNSELSPDFVASQLELTVWETIPNNAPLAVHSTNTGEPIIMSHPDSNVAAAIRRAARRLAGLPLEEPRRRWFFPFM